VTVPSGGGPKHSAAHVCSLTGATNISRARHKARINRIHGNREYWRLPRILGVCRDSHSLHFCVEIHKFLL